MKCGSSPILSQTRRLHTTGALARPDELVDRFSTAARNRSSAGRAPPDRDRSGTKSQGRPCDPLNSPSQPSITAFTARSPTATRTMKSASCTRSLGEKAAEAPRAIARATCCGGQCPRRSGRIELTGSVGRKTAHVAQANQTRCGAVLSTPFRLHCAPSLWHVDLLLGAFRWQARRHTL